LSSFSFVASSRAAAIGSPGKGSANIGRGDRRQEIEDRKQETGNR
jgi:hypothetical protein